MSRATIAKRFSVRRSSTSCGDKTNQENKFPARMCGVTSCITGLASLIPPSPISLRHHKGFGPVRYVDQHANRVAQVLHDVTHDGYIEACHARVELAHMRFDQAGARIEGLVREPDPLRSASRRGRRVWRMSAPSAPDRGNKS